MELPAEASADIEKKDASSRISNTVAPTFVGFQQDDRTRQVSIKIPDGTTESAESRFIESVEAFSSALARETSRLEEEIREADEDPPQVTSTMVREANDTVRNPNSDTLEPISGWTISAQIVAAPTGLGAGVFGSYLNSAWQWAGLLVLGSIFVLCQLYVVLALRRRM